MKDSAAPVSHEDIDPESVAVHDWRVNRLTGLGLPRRMAELVADRVDWHEVARLVQHGCPASLAIAIVEGYCPATAARPALTRTGRPRARWPG